MAGFIVKTGVQVLKGSAQVAKGTVKQGVQITPRVVRPAYEFGRAAITGAPRVAALGEGGATVSTIYASTRAGMQVNQLTRAAAYAAATKAPKVAVAVGKFAARTAFKDAVVQPFIATPYRIYSVLRGGRSLRGASTAVERYADKMLGGTARILDKYRVAPTLRGDIASVARIAVYGTIYAGLKQAGRGITDVGAYVDAMADQYKGARDALAAQFPIPIPPDVPATPAIPLPAPVVPDAPPRAVVPTAPPPPPEKPPVVTTTPLPIRRVR